MFNFKNLITAMQDQYNEEGFPFQALPVSLPSEDLEWKFEDENFPTLFNLGALPGHMELYQDCSHLESSETPTLHSSLSSSSSEIEGIESDENDFREQSLSSKRKRVDFSASTSENFIESFQRNSNDKRGWDLRHAVMGELNLKSLEYSDLRRQTGVKARLAKRRNK